MADQPASTAYEEELLVSLAQIEELTDQQLVSIIKNILAAVGTGHNIDSVNGLYHHFYEELDKRYAGIGQPNPNPFADLWQFYEFWAKEGLSTYASRRAYVAGLYRQSNSSDDSRWKLLNVDIVAVARSRYDSQHYADAVEAALKEINSRIKNYVKQKTGEEYDGADLMNRAFSLANPIMVLDDLSTEDGKNIQKGYMQMFAGAMTGIRNPKAHKNSQLGPEECMHLLYLASHLMSVVEPILNEKLYEAEIEKKAKRVYVRLEKTDDSKTLLRVKDMLDKFADDDGMEVVLVLGSSNNRQAVRLPRQVKDSPEFIEQTQRLVGKGNVVIQ